VASLWCRMWATLCRIRGHNPMLRIVEPVRALVARGKKCATLPRLLIGNDVFERGGFDEAQQRAVHRISERVAATRDQRMARGRVQIFDWVMFEIDTVTDPRSIAHLSRWTSNASQNYCLKPNTTAFSPRRTIRRIVDEWSQDAHWEELTSD
jgi:hypothetical protein